MAVNVKRNKLLKGEVQSQSTEGDYKMGSGVGWKD